MAMVITTPAICREHEGKPPFWTRAQARRVLRETRSPGAASNSCSWSPSAARRCSPWWRCSRWLWC